ncbi:efflux RND transporter permease subunit [Alteromonas sp. 009811495]|uniref:efflux RND transporter permease subunit n=1 Tax=Alteromonas sp. 009811495 TaxID=3002962 RepID=UPI00237E4573|nr:efflux RND transporter permease subunit [Alteromonas sp. 009811495]WDT87634.1 efflux RND transporter permease subunit [Alteromonas sp. 009811495]
MVEYFFRQKVISWMVAIILGLGGIVTFLGLGQLEFPEFTIRNALVITQYPGATPEQVEEEVTLQLEKAIQRIPNVKRVSSVNMVGSSQITVELKSSVQEKDLEQYWDNLRRKISDAQASLPPGTSTSIVNDDFGDVFGLLMTLRSEDYTLKQMEDFADLMQREIQLVEGVKKISIAGTVNEQIIVSLDHDKMKALNVSTEAIAGLLTAQNIVGNAGSIKVQGKRLSIQPTGEFDNLEALGQVVIGSPASGLIRLTDIATIERTLNDTPSILYHSSGAPALSIGVSFASAVNVVDVGKRLEAKIAELEARMPLGMELTTVYNQPTVVDDSVTGFLINLVEAVAIVIFVLLLFMGWRSGVLMGLILVLTILGTFILMSIKGIELQKISLGALIIALGMLVDNAIVVTEGMLIGVRKGQTKLQAAKDVVSQNGLPLLGATVIAITAFAPIGLSPDATGEFVGSLFWVLCFSLFLSWITALTITPFFFDLLFKTEKEQGSSEDDDPYKGIIFTVYKRFLTAAINFRYVTIVIVLLALVGGVASSKFVKNAFFPDSSTPLFFVDLWLPEGSDVLTTEQSIRRLENRVMQMEEIANVTSVIGGGAQRLTLTYAPEDRYASYGQLIVETNTVESRDARMREIIELVREDFPNVQYKVKALQVGPSAKAAIEARIYGPEPEVLREISSDIEAIFNAEQTMDSVRLSWSNKVPFVEPVFLEEQARRIGVTRDAVHTAFLLNNEGQSVGLYREGSDLIPIVMRNDPNQRYDIDNLASLNVWSQEQGKYISMADVISNVDVSLDNPIIKRRNRVRMLAVYAEPLPLSGETAASVQAKVRPLVDELTLPDGYSIEWGGEYETSRDAQKALFASMPIGIIGMFIITVLLFGKLRQALAIWGVIPLTTIGIIGGLVLVGAPFTFMALLGSLSLIGMVLKNGIVLMEEINVQSRGDGDAFTAVINASVSRVRPVSMAAITTILGMIPLFSDAFFASMAVVIVFGLTVATVLTLLILPVLHCTFHGIKAEK